jgi:branched-chain amino acid transport system ATP-binding protein
VSTALLQVDGLDLYYGDAQALSRVSLEIAAGEIVAIVGANGAGKSSLIRAIHGIEKPARGTLRFDGVDIAGWPSHRVCEAGIGHVAEGRQIFPNLSVLENLEMGATPRRARAAEKQTLDRVFAMFPRLAERRHQTAGTLSGGEQQMLAIGRCLMGQPRLVMFDEPSLGLAPVVVEEMFRVIRRLNTEDGLTIVLVEQNVAQSLALAHRGYVLETGRIVLAGTAPGGRRRQAGVCGNLRRENVIG